MENNFNFFSSLIPGSPSHQEIEKVSNDLALESFVLVFSNERLETLNERFKKCLEFPGSPLVASSERLEQLESRKGAID